MILSWIREPNQRWPLVLERGYFNFLNPVTSPEWGAPRSVFSNQMLQAQNSFGRFTPTPGRLNTPLELHTRLLFHRRLGVYIHGLIAFANRARIALAKDLHPFRLQTSDVCRLCAVENPKLEFRNFRQRGQFLQLWHRGLERNITVSCEMESDMGHWFTFLIASFWIFGKQRRSSGKRTVSSWTVRWDRCNLPFPTISVQSLPMSSNR